MYNPHDAKMTLQNTHMMCGYPISAYKKSISQMAFTKHLISAAKGGCLIS